MPYDLFFGCFLGCQTIWSVHLLKLYLDAFNSFKQRKKTVQFLPRVSHGEHARDQRVRGHADGGLCPPTRIRKEGESKKSENGKVVKKRVKKSKK